MVATNQKDKLASDVNSGTDDYHAVKINMPVIVKGVMAGLVILGVFLLLVGFLPGGILLGVSGLMYFKGLKDIKANPPHKGLLKVWETRLPKVENEGKVVTADYWPFFLTYEPVKVEKINEDFSFDVRCNKNANDKDGKSQSGAKVKVPISIVYTPDPENFIQFQNSGGEEGVRNILTEMMAEDARQMGKDNTWEGMTFAGDDLSKNLIHQLTGQEFRSEDKSEVDKLRLTMEKNGFPDIRGLGIKVRRLNVGEIEPLGAVSEAADLAVKEELELRGDLVETNGEVEQAKILLLALKEYNSEITLWQCIQEIRRRKSVNTGHGAVYDIPGLENIAPIVAKILKN